MSRQEAEALAATGETPACDAECSHCKKVGAFVSDMSIEGGAIVDDLTFDAYAGRLRHAGYDVLLYSTQCNQGQHHHCTGENLMNSGAASGLNLSMTHMLDLLEPDPNGSRLPKRCLCPCHRRKQPLPLFPGGAYENMKRACRAFNEPITEAVRSLAQAAGLTDEESRRVAARVIMDLMIKSALENNLSEEAFEDWLYELMQLQIAEALKKRAAARQTRRWLFWK